MSETQSEVCCNEIDNEQIKQSFYVLNYNIGECLRNSVSGSLMSGMEPLGLCEGRMLVADPVLEGSLEGPNT
jgi:hypothetical protein